MVEGDGDINICVVLARVRIGFDVEAQRRRVRRVRGDIRDPDGNFCIVFGLVQSVFQILELIQTYALTSIDDELRSVGLFLAQGYFIRALAISECRRGVRIFPALLVPVSDVLAQNDQLSSWDRLVVIQALENDVGRRTAGATFRGKELDQHGDARLRGGWSWRLVLRLRGLRLQICQPEK